MGLLSRGADFLNRALGNAAGQTLTYTRGVTSDTLTGWAGNEQRDQVQQPSTGTRVNDRERDFLLSYSEMTLAGFDEPAVGDRITETINGDEVTWEVKPRDTEPAWRWSDTTRTRYRVHTRRVTA